MNIKRGVIIYSKDFYYTSDKKSTGEGITLNL